MLGHHFGESARLASALDVAELTCVDIPRRDYVNRWAIHFLTEHADAEVENIFKLYQLGHSGEDVLHYLAEKHAQIAGVGDAKEKCHDWGI